MKCEKMKILILLLTLAVSLNASAVDNPRIEIESNDSFAMHRANNKNIEEITTKNTALSGVVDGYKKCIDKGLIFLGAGASNVDSDNCYDVTNTLNPETKFRQTLAGFLTTSVVRYNASTDPLLKGRFGPDVQCNAKFAGSRAMVFDDITYVRASLVTPANITKKPIWLFDSLIGYASGSSSNIVGKDEISNPGTVNACNGWNSTSVADKGTVFYPDDYTVLKQTCDTGAYIACIYN